MQRYAPAEPIAGPAVLSSIERHVAGATVTHNGPFAGLHVPVNKQLLPTDIRENWVRPLYFGLNKPHVKEFLSERLHLVDDELITQLLANFDWRPRTAAAYLAALTDRKSFTNQIGRLLLRSDVCYAGSAYCLALAEFNSPESSYFLDEYLTYYLTRHDLWFDQGDAMGALSYLDCVNGSTNVERHMDAWNKFVETKNNWSLAGSVAHFAQSMTELHDLKANSARIADSL